MGYAFLQLFKATLLHGGASRRTRRENELVDRHTQDRCPHQLDWPLAQVLHFVMAVLPHLFSPELPSTRYDDAPRNRPGNEDRRDHERGAGPLPRRVARLSKRHPCLPAAFPPVKIGP
jgi:hypothetical protein